mmetsp:Transcript_21979/g.43611  ORF Transcript_21979/g.43611 Transcript_21979/m.43611 type:complete len:117 (+) Transcript_21979:201-551(+)
MACLPPMHPIMHPTGAVVSVKDANGRTLLEDRDKRRLTGGVKTAARRNNKGRGSGRGFDHRVVSMQGKFIDLSVHVRRASLQHSSTGSLCLSLPPTHRHTREQRGREREKEGQLVL